MMYIYICDLDIIHLYEQYCCTSSVLKRSSLACPQNISTINTTYEIFAKGQSEDAIQRMTDNITTKRKLTKIPTMAHLTLYRMLNIEQHQSHQQFANFKLQIFNLDKPNYTKKTRSFHIKKHKL
jgi:hypothetical protein